MSVDTMTWSDLPQFKNRHVLIYGIDENAINLATHILEKYPDITIDYFLQKSSQYQMLLGIPVISLDRAREENLLDGSIILVATKTPPASSNLFINDHPAELRYVSTQLQKIFHPEKQPRRLKTKKTVTPFYLERGTPPVPALISNAYIAGGPGGENIFELADFKNQQYITWTMPSPGCPLSLREFAAATPTSTLPMRMSHLSYLLWKRGVHVTQLSPSRKWLVGVRYNYFFLDLLNTESGELTRWHDLPPEDGLWDYVATGDFDGDKDEFLFVRWPVKDTIKGMNDRTNRVRCQVCRLDLETQKATILQEFDFQDRIHQCTISDNGRYMVFAPMRVLRPKGDLSQLRDEDLMRNLRENVILDSMATLDLETGKVWTTKIPTPIPAHFELDPFDPNLFYVSTHSLMPHSGGVICFQPGVLYKMRIKDGETVVEAQYSHPAFVRTTQHCVFAWEGQTYIAATNQNKLEIIDASTMTLWYAHKIADDPFYDSANFNDPEFLKKPFTLPPQPAWCDSVSASGDGAQVIMHLTDRFCIFDMASKKVIGNVHYRSHLLPQFTTTHGRYWMQNAPLALVKKAYATL